MSEIGLFFGFGDSVTFAEGTCHLISSFANSCVIETDDGLILFDIGQERFGPLIFEKLREITLKPIKFIIYSHGHFDHCFGFKAFLDEIKEKGFDQPQIIAHANVVKRFEKYKELQSYQKWINSQQFSSVIGDEYDGPSIQKTLYPTIIVRNSEFKFHLGGHSFHLYHEWGETDDALWLWFPRKKVIFSGDLIISSFPNVGNPFKVQRYPKDWARALEHMMRKKSEYIAPGHGNLIVGTKNVNETLLGTAEAMHFIHDEVVKRMNEGKWFEQIFDEMKKIFPEEWKEKQYLQPIYGCYEFAVHAVYRLYHGWYDSGNPTNLFPSKSSDIAKELLKINSAESYILHSKKLLNENKFQLALHMIDLVINALETNSLYLIEALSIKKKILEKLLEKNSSFIVQNIYRNEIIKLQDRISKLSQFK